MVSRLRDSIYVYQLELLKISRVVIVALSLDRVIGFLAFPMQAHSIYILNFVLVADEHLHVLTVRIILIIDPFITVSLKKTSTCIGCCLCSLGITTA